MPGPAVTRAGLVALAAALLAACGESEPRLTEATLEDLARFPDTYQGRRVAATGTVRMHPSPEHYWIEDDALHRVEVLPPEVVSSRVGEQVRVEGRFRYAPDRGRAIEEATVTGGD